MILIDVFLHKNGKMPVKLESDRVKESPRPVPSLITALSKAFEYKEEYGVDPNSWSPIPVDGGEEHRFACNNGTFSVIIR